MDNSTNYQCPACTAPLRYDAKSSKLQCDHCSSSFEVAEIQKLYADPTAAQPTANAPTDQDWHSNLNNNWGEDAPHMRAYGCTSCGAEIICDETTAATSCLYCGNNTVVQSQFEGALRPDFVIPFKMSKEDAVNSLKKHCKGKFLLPKFFANDVHVEEIKGVYVPVWLFDGSVEVDISYKASKSTSVTSGNYRTTTTKHYDVHREGSVSFRDIPVDSSSKMPDEYMESIEPFDYRELKPFSMAYMPGFLADKYDVSMEQCSLRADKRAEEAALSIMRNSISGYDKCSEKSQAISLNRGVVQYAMTPVWLLTTRWKNKVYLFAMNGQTGTFAGDLPCDMVKFYMMFLGLTAAITPIAYLLLNWISS